MAAGSPTLLALSPLHDPSLRTLLTCSTTCSSISLYRSHPLPFSLSYTRSTAGAIDASSSAGGVFLDDIGLHRLQTLEKYIREDKLDGGGWLEIRHMEDGEVDPTVMLLSDSYAETMGVPQRYVPLLSFFVRQYLVERRSLVPHAAMLVGFYRDGGAKEPELACTAEVSFDSRGANAAPPTPLPPSDFPYICNMAVKKALRRKGIGRRLLKACEELISRMKTNKKVYLHCRVIDRGPLMLYKKSDYRIDKTDSILVWLTLQRRKHLLVKELPLEEDAPPDGHTAAVVVDC